MCPLLHSHSIDALSLDANLIARLLLVDLPEHLRDLPGVLRDHLVLFIDNDQTLPRLFRILIGMLKLHPVSLRFGLRDIEQREDERRSYGVEVEVVAKIGDIDLFVFSRTMRCDRPAVDVHVAHIERCEPEILSHSVQRIAVETQFLREDTLQECLKYYEGPEETMHLLT